MCVQGNIVQYIVCFEKEKKADICIHNGGFIQQYRH